MLFSKHWSDIGSKSHVNFTYVKSDMGSSFSDFSELSISQLQFPEVSFKTCWEITFPIKFM